ncbi:MAG: aminotransferase class III-fold pyridoxal phosphate-dependent enzyme [Gammaproteobacteria bacterium]|nr:aminotransferase class III-fold pyridoxal phosphate-dependent enzyme [Gammaproteobacteria bacterium]
MTNPMPAEVAERYKDGFLAHLSQTVPGRKEMVITSASGCRITAADGVSYLDMISGIAVSNVGHSHPEVVAAVEHQMRRFAHVNVFGRFVLPPQVDIAERLTRVAPGELDIAFLTSTGTEANEGALKLARKYTGRPGYVAFEGSFHGRTYGSLSVSWRERYRAPFQPLLEKVTFVPFGDLDAAAAAIGDDTAGVIVEPVQGEAGVRIPSDDFLPGLREVCTERGALLIADDVQGAMGRSGHWYTCQEWGVTPDVITVAKAVGGGLPLGAFISTAEIFATFLDPPLSHLTTFGGNPVSCAAATAAFDIIERDGLVERAVEMGEYLSAGFARLMDRHETLVAARGLGLWWAFDVAPDDLAMPVVQAMERRGVIVGSMLNADGTIRVAPPLIVTTDELDELLDALDESLTELEGVT